MISWIKGNETSLASNSLIDLRTLRSSLKSISFYPLPYVIIIYTPQAIANLKKSVTLVPACAGMTYGRIFAPGHDRASFV